MVRTKHHIGGYRVIAPIGAGGFATVYRALDETTRQEVAIKVLAENHSLVADTRRRFVDEVGLLATVDSPTIAKIYQVGETETGQPYMVLELADRGDLRRRVEEMRRKHRVLNRADLAMLAHHLWESLTTLHRAEIVHRDVSPGNILIRSRKTPGQGAKARNGDVTLLEPGERFLLADLGHAKDMILASGFTAGGGTRGYAAPEQRDDVTVVDLRADIFSATAVIEWAAHDGEFADDLEPFFDIGLAEDPDDRFNSMTEWHNAFTEALDAGIRARTSLPDRIAERVDARMVAVSVAAVILGGLAAAAAVQFGRSSEQPAAGGGDETEQVDADGDGSGDADPGGRVGDDPAAPGSETPPSTLRVSQADVDPGATTVPDGSSPPADGDGSSTATSEADPTTTRPPDGATTTVSTASGG